MILDAACAAFARDGIHGATMDDIAGLAELPKPILYRHWESKDELFEATVQAECDRLTDQLFIAYAKALDLPVQERVVACTRAFFEYAAERRDGFRLLFGTGGYHSSSVAARVEDLHREIGERVADMVRRELSATGRPSGVGADVIAALFVGMVDYTVRRMSENDGWDPEAVLGLVTEFALGGGAAITDATLAAVDRGRSRKALRSPRRNGPR